MSGIKADLLQPDPVCQIWLNYSSSSTLVIEITPSWQDTLLVSTTDFYYYVEVTVGNIE